MATVLLGWEQGEGLDHLQRLWPIGQGLATRGHRVVAVLRDLALGTRYLGPGISACLQAPVHFKPIANASARPLTFAHVLSSFGFSDAGTLSGLVDAWRWLYDAIKPDMVILDHCPVGLLAARGLPIKRVLTGNVFICPPDDDPLPPLVTWAFGVPCGPIRPMLPPEGSRRC